MLLNIVSANLETEVGRIVSDIDNDVEERMKGRN